MDWRDAGHRLRVGFGAVFQKTRRQLDLILLRRNVQRRVAILRGGKGEKVLRSLGMQCSRGVCLCVGRFPLWEKGCSSHL